MLRGTAVQRAVFLATASSGMLWQDTDGIKMIWRKDATAWVPAVWRWSGTSAQMGSFTQAPNGFEWFNTTDNCTYVRFGGAWVNLQTHSISATSGAVRPLGGFFTMPAEAWSLSIAPFYGRSSSFTLPFGIDSNETITVSASAMSSTGFDWVSAVLVTKNPSSTVVNMRLMRAGNASTTAFTVAWRLSTIAS